jgi:dolichol kinase
MNQSAGMTSTTTPEAAGQPAAFHDRLRTANRVFRGALYFNAALTVFGIFVQVTHEGFGLFHYYPIGWDTVPRIGGGILFFYVIWGFVWYAVKNVLLRYFVGFTKEERRQAFSSRMRQPFDVASLTARYSERRIRITDMIGRRGRFITLAMAAFFYLYTRVQTEHSSDFATLFLGDNLLDGVMTSWVFLGFYYADGFLAAAFYGPQSRVMDGVLARANCLLITTLWTAFKFVMVPLGTRLAAVFPAAQFAALFALIWGSYIVTDALAEIGGSLFGRQRIRVLGIGDVNRKSIGGTVSGLVGALVFCLWIVRAHGLPASWIGLAVVIALSNTVIELFAPRGTDDFFMATANAALCLAFGLWVA